MRINGRYNQVKGPFAAGVDLLAPGGAIDLATPEQMTPILTKVGILADPGTRVIINESNVEISAAGGLELDNVVEIRHLIFPNGAKDNVLIDFIY